MGQYREPEGWISLEDYIIRGIRDEAGHKMPIAEQLHMPSAPKNWVSAEEYFVGNVRKTAPPPPAASYVECLRAPPPEPPQAPEASNTMYEALDEVMAPTKSQELERRLDEMAREDRREFAAGLINQDELERRQIAASIIAENHNRRKERIADWYLENYFRIFENPEPEE